MDEYYRQMKSEVRGSKSLPKILLAVFRMAAQIILIFPLVQLLGMVSKDKHAAIDYHSSYAVSHAEAGACMSCEACHTGHTGNSHGSSCYTMNSCG